MTTPTLDPSDPAILAWREGRAIPNTHRPNAGNRLSDKAKAWRRVAKRKRDTEHRRMARWRKAIANGRTPGIPGRPTTTRKTNAPFRY